MTKLLSTFFLVSIFILNQYGCSFGAIKKDPAYSPKIAWEDEVFYQIFPRSFYDSNGDGIGDFKGIEMKLNYLQELGVSAIWLNPIMKSRCYHNYFADDFFTVDEDFGTNQDFINLVKAVHKRGMKILIDMETQYATEEHIWFKASYKNPKSKYSKYILYADTNNEIPVLGPFDLAYLPGYDGQSIRLLNVNLKNPEILSQQKKIFKYWTDPNGDGNCYDGVDGFRLDHVMDDLDAKGILTNLLNDFWKPIISSVRKVNPNSFFIAEQADWGYGGNLLTTMDACFTLPLTQAARSLDKYSILSAVEGAINNTPEKKHQLAIIENHDTNRFASSVGGDVNKLKIGAAINLTLENIPCIYYGQELGMQGAKIEAPNDGADIPNRAAFEWYKDTTGPGMALWYKNSGPWWDSASAKANDGISYAEQVKSNSSLWNFYKKIIKLRKSNIALSKGKYKELVNDNDCVLSYLRHYKGKAGTQNIAVIINLSEELQTVKLDLNSLELALNNNIVIDLLGSDTYPAIRNDNSGSYSLNLSGYQICILNIKK